jgi:rhodanese-related sulfurtransferase
LAATCHFRRNARLNTKFILLFTNRAAYLQHNETGNQQAVVVAYKRLAGFVLSYLYSFTIFRPRLVRGFFYWRQIPERVKTAMLQMGSNTLYHE